MSQKRVGPSEFEKRGPLRSGVLGLAKAWEKLRVIVRTGQDPEAAPELDAEPVTEDGGGRMGWPSGG